MFHSEAGMALNGYKNTKSAIPSLKIDFSSGIKSEKDINKPNIKSLNEHLSTGKNTQETRAQTPYSQSLTNETQSSLNFHPDPYQSILQGYILCKFSTPH